MWHLVSGRRASEKNSKFFFEFLLWNVLSFLLHLYYTLTPKRVHMHLQGHIDLLFVQRKRLEMWHVVSGGQLKTIESFFFCIWMRKYSFGNIVHEWSPILMRMNAFKFHPAVTSFAACDITSVIHSELVFIRTNFIRTTSLKMTQNLSLVGNYKSFISMGPNMISILTSYLLYQCNL